MDAELVRRAQRGDKDAYDALARISANRMYAVAHRILGHADRAEDALQQALINVWTELPKLRDPGRFEAWTYRLVVRSSLAEARRYRSVAVMELDNLDASMSAPDDAAGLVTRDRLSRAFGQLSPEHRAVVVLHHYLGFSLPEIADALQIPYGTVGSRLHTATHRLRTVLGEPDPDLATGGQPA